MHAMSCNRLHQLASDYIFSLCSLSCLSIKKRLAAILKRLALILMRLALVLTRLALVLKRLAFILVGT